jgi:hypothetical protein
MNWYAYAGNNPVVSVDPEGLFADWLIDPVFVALDIYSLVKKPSWANAGLLGADVLLAVAPFVPAGAGASAHAAQAVCHVGEAGRAAHAASGAAKLAGQAHHLLPRAFAKRFARAGLDIEAAEFKVVLPAEKHILKPNGVHTNLGGNWNKQWKEFFDKYPEAERWRILKQLQKMRREFGV